VTHEAERKSVLEKDGTLLGLKWDYRDVTLDTYQRDATWRSQTQAGCEVIFY